METFQEIDKNEHRGTMLPTYTIWIDATKGRMKVDIQKDLVKGITIKYQDGRIQTIIPDDGDGFNFE